MATIGFIGLGNMGAPVAANLIKAGHQVTGFDVVPRAAEALVEKGGHAAASAAEAAAAGELVITMLPAGARGGSRSFYAGGGGRHAPPSGARVDACTTNARTARRIRSG